MKTRSKPVRGQRQSWRDRDAPISSGLLFYRRLVATVLVVLFVAAFIAVLVIFWPKGVSWTSEHLVIAEYDPDSAPPLNYADRQKQSWTSGLPSSLDVAGSATQSGELAASVAKLAGSQQTRKAPLLVYVAGHGCSVGEEGFLYASDLDPSGAKPPGVKIQELLAAVVKHPAQATVLIIDSGPLEHDLRLGTAVNRFPELLEREVERVPLAEGETLIVLASHRPWERAFVSPTKHLSVFGFYVNEGLSSPDFNADKLRFDLGKSDEQISVLELAGYVQQHVSGWVWKASGQTRIQRPLVLYAEGTTRRALELVHDTRPQATDAEFAQACQKLGQLILPTFRPPAAEAATAFHPFESAAYGQDPAAPSSAAAASAAKDDPAAKSKAAAAESKQGDSPTGEKARSPVPAAPAAPPPPDARPDWMRAHARLIAESFGSAAADAEWTAADYDVAAVRRAWRDMLYAQQKELAGAKSDAVSFSSARPASWDPLQDWRADPPTHHKLRHAARIRDAALLRLEQYIGGLDAAEALAHDDTRLVDELNSLWIDFHTGLSRLSESMDQEAFLDTPAADPNGPTINLSSGSQSGSVQDIITAGHVVEESSRKLGARLEELLLPKSAKSRWLPRWELAQAAPLAAWTAHAPDPTADETVPLLGFAPPAAAQTTSAATDKPPQAPASTASKVVLPSRNNVNQVETLLRKRRKRWLDRQALVANLLPQESAAAAISVPGDTDAELNAAARQIADRHRSAVKWLRENFTEGAPSAGVQKLWNADRVLRVALAVEQDRPQTLASPLPLNFVKRKEQPYLLRLVGPAEEIPLELGQQQPVRFAIERGSDRPFDPAVAEIRLQIPEGLAVTHKAKPITSGDYPLAQLSGEGNAIELSVAATRELEIASGGKLEEPLKSLTLILTLGSVTNAKATSTARFRLPGAPHLDVLVAGYEGTVEHAPDLSPRGSGADREFHLNPPPVTPTAAPADRSRVKVHLRPMPLGETSYRLHLVNRSTVPRNILARWHVLDDPRPAAGWTEVQGQIGDASQRSRLRPELLAPGRKWLIPLYEEDQPAPPPPAGAPPAAAAPPPAEPKPPLSIGNGLVCQLTDLGDPNWSQWIWITAEPRQPDSYLRKVPRLTGNGSGAEILIGDDPQSSALLPPGRTTVISGNPRSGLLRRRVAFSQKEVKGVLAKGDLTLVAQLPTRNADDETPIPFGLDVDGYPRALRFMAGTSSVQSIADRGGVQLRLLAAADPPMPGKEDALLAEDQLCFAKAPKLRCEIEADFPIDPADYAVVLSRADTFQEQLAEFYADRTFVVQCRRQPPEESALRNLSVICRVGELSRPLDWLTADTGYEPPMRIRLRAEIATYDQRGKFEPLQPPMRHEVEIVLDNQPPQLVKSPAATLDWDKRQRLPLISFTLSDADRAGAGSGLASVAWGTMAKGPGELADGQILPLPEEESSEAALHIAVPQKLLSMPGKPVDILLVARDRAGNVLGPETIQTINVKAVPEKKQAPKGSDSKK